MGHKIKNDMLEIVDFFIEEDCYYYNYYYPMVKLSDGRKYYINYDRFMYCEWYYRDGCDKNNNIFVLTKNPGENSFCDTFRSLVNRFLSNFKKDVFYNQFRSGCTYTMKIGDIKITEFSELIRLLRMEESGEQSIITFRIDDKL